MSKTGNYVKRTDRSSMSVSISASARPTIIVIFRLKLRRRRRFYRRFHRTRTAVRVGIFVVLRHHIVRVEFLRRSVGARCRFCFCSLLLLPPPALETRKTDSRQRYSPRPGRKNGVYSSGRPGPRRCVSVGRCVISFRARSTSN